MLIAKNISFAYPNGPHLFDNLNLCLTPTGVIPLIGDNGSGKTTLLRILSGFILTSKGGVSIDDRSIQLGDISYMPANQDSFFYQLTGRESLELYAELNKQPRKIWNEEPFQNLVVLKKALDTKFSFCSTGMKQALNFTRALNNPSKIFLLDEPFRGLDTEAKLFFLNFIKSLSRHNLIIISTHEITELELLCYDKKIIIDNQRVTYD